MNGIINIYKEQGYTSFDVVARLRGICRQKKIGHTGTLDPDATGVLPVCLGNATSLCDLLTDKTKEYETVLLLGITTDTQDVSGTVLKQQDVNLNEADVVSCIGQFTGDIEQIPPMYSAIKIDGRKLYELAREGKTVERRARSVTIHSIDILSIDLPRVTMRVACSKGTYIRTLCNDIGESLGCGGTMESLIRTRSGDFRIEDASKLDTVREWADEGKLQDHILSVEEIFGGCSSIRMNATADKLLHNGNTFRKMDVVDITKHGTTDNASDRADIHNRNSGYGETYAGVKTGIHKERYRVYDSEGTFYGVYDYDSTRKLYRPFKMFIP
ncbi:MAG: tRNA pseudouridine(55) synthase TruB [Lachnospiraceae bacterium]|nr:tRNA pseudouridine(55) synthase TruB [Lachnospiraceae bacterium]